MLLSDGYALVPGALPPPALAAARGLARDVVAEGRESRCDRENNVLLGLRHDDPLVTTVLQAPGFAAAVAAVSGATDLRWISGYVSVREPGTGPLGLHQDWWCWDEPVSFGERPPQVAAIVYLDDTDAANAALTVLPGSHRRATPVHEALDAEGAAAPDLPVPDDTVTLGVDAGDMVVLDYRVLHGTTANRTTRRRDAVILNFTPDWAALPLAIRGHLSRHLALPLPGEPVDAWLAASGLLPAFEGEAEDLPLVRRPPVGSGRLRPEA